LLSLFYIVNNGHNPTTLVPKLREKNNQAVGTRCTAFMNEKSLLCIQFVFTQGIHCLKVKIVPEIGNYL